MAWLPAKSFAQTSGSQNKARRCKCRRVPPTLCIVVSSPGLAAVWGVFLFVFMVLILLPLMGNELAHVCPENPHEQPNDIDVGPRVVGPSP